MSTPYTGNINFLWYGNPLAPKYLSAAFEGPLSFLKATQQPTATAEGIPQPEFSGATLTYWCPAEHKEKVKQYLDNRCRELGLVNTFEVKSVEDDLLEQLVSKGHLNEDEKGKILKLLTKIKSYGDFNVAKELFSPLILLLEGGYFFDTTIYLHAKKEGESGFLSLPEITQDFRYTFHNGTIIRPYPQLDVYTYAGRKDSPTLKGFAYLNIETIARLYDEDLTEVAIDPLNGFPEKNRIIDSHRLDVMVLAEKFKELRYKDTAQQEVATGIFYPRSRLEKPAYYLQSVEKGKACFTYQTAPTITNAPRFMERFFGISSSPITFQEKGFHSELELDNYRIVKSFGQSGWYHSGKQTNLISQLKIYLDIFSKTITIATPVIIKHVLGVILNLLKRILFLSVPQNPLTLRQKLTLAYTENDLPNQARNERVAQDLPPIVPVTETPGPT